MFYFLCGRLLNVHKLNGSILFSSGVLVSCDLAVTDSGRTKGFALIKFQDKACAAAAIRMNNTDIIGCAMQI